MITARSENKLMMKSIKALNFQGFCIFESSLKGSITEIDKKIVI
jgi:hypothetical protein